MLSITAAGVAVTLTTAHRVLFAELFWTPSLLLQAEDRAHRIGQTEDVKVKYLLLRGGLDDVLWELARRKFRALGEFVEGKEVRDGGWGRSREGKDVERVGDEG